MEKQQNNDNKTGVIEVVDLTQTKKFYRNDSFVLRSWFDKYLVLSG